MLSVVGIALLVIVALGLCSVGIALLVGWLINKNKQKDSLDARAATAFEGLGAVSHTAPAEDRTHSGGVIRGGSPCATMPPHRDASLPAQPDSPVTQQAYLLRDLAARALTETLEPGSAYDGRGDWSDCLNPMLDGAVGQYCAALHPDSLVAVLDSLLLLSGPCEAYKFGRCTALLPIKDSCNACIAVAALEALTTVREVEQ